VTEESLHLSKRFKLYVYGGLDDGQPTQGIGDYDLEYGNPYVSIYGVPIDNHKHASQLAVYESTLLRFALSGQKPTVYRLQRVA
jgi:hypothetical protein